MNGLWWTQSPERKRIGHHSEPGSLGGLCWSEGILCQNPRNLTLFFVKMCVFFWEMTQIRLTLVTRVES